VNLDRAGSVYVGSIGMEQIQVLSAGSPEELREAFYRAVDTHLGVGVDTTEAVAPDSESSS
jgi:hypothetical protein